MEDAHTSEIGLGPDAPLKDWSFFAVFDGHAGSKVAAYSSTNLLPAILATDDIKEAVQLLKVPSTFSSRCVEGSSGCCGCSRGALSRGGSGA